MTDATLRPLLFARVQFDRDGDGCGEWCRDVFLAEQVALRDDLTAEQAGANNPDEVARIRQMLVFSIDLLRDIQHAILDVGANRRMRVYRGGQAEWAVEVLRDEQAALYDDLDRLRRTGKTEDNREVVEVRQQLMWSVNVLRDLDAARISLVGPNEDQRVH